MVSAALHRYKLYQGFGIRGVLLFLRLAQAGFGAAYAAPALAPHAKLLAQMFDGFGTLLNSLVDVVLVDGVADTNIHDIFGMTLCWSY